MVAVPVLLAVAVKLTIVAGQTVVPGLLLIVTDGVRDGTRCMLSESDIALVEVRQFIVPVKEMVQFTTSPSAKVEVV